MIHIIWWAVNFRKYELCTLEDDLSECLYSWACNQSLNHSLVKCWYVTSFAEAASPWSRCGHAFCYQILEWYAGIYCQNTIFVRTTFQKTSEFLTPFVLDSCILTLYHQICFIQLKWTTHLPLNKYRPLWRCHGSCLYQWWCHGKEAEISPEW